MQDVVDRNGRQWTICDDEYAEPIGADSLPRNPHQHRRRDHVRCTLDFPHVGVHEHGPSGTRWFAGVRFPDREGAWSPKSSV